MAKGGIGTPLPRLEDGRLLTGGGCYSDDFTLPGQAYALGRALAARRMPASSPSTRRPRATCPACWPVLTGADVLADGLKPIPHIPAAHEPARHQAAQHRRLAAQGRAADGALAIDGALRRRRRWPSWSPRRWRIAKDAAEAVQVEYEELPPLADVAVDSLVGDPAATAGGLRQGAPRREAADRHPARHRRADGAARRARPLRCGVGPLHACMPAAARVVRPKKEVAIILGIEPEQVRVIASEVGGNFGTRNSFYPEFALVAWASRRSRPAGEMDLRAAARRSSATMPGRDLCGRDRSWRSMPTGTFLALRAPAPAISARYTASFVPLTKGTAAHDQPLPHAGAHGAGARCLSNTPPTAPYRSAGRPEVDVRDRAADRSRGAARTASTASSCAGATSSRRDAPYANAFGVTYDSGDYVDAIDAALTLADWNGFAAAPGRGAAARPAARHRARRLRRDRRAARRAKRAEVTVLPRRRGRGGDRHAVGGPGPRDQLRPARQPNGWACRPTACASSPATPTACRSAAARIPGRSMRLAGDRPSARPRDGIIAKGRELAAHLLEARRSRHRLRRRPLHRRTAPTARIGLVRRCAARDAPAPICATARGRCRQSRVGSYPYGWHVCEVEVDAETGVVEIDALHRDRRCRPRGESADPARPDPWRHRPGRRPGADGALRLRSATASCCRARSWTTPCRAPTTFRRFATALSEVPSTNHPLGFRGGGEGGITPALGVIINAVVDALADLGVTHIDMPASPERVWRAIRDARRAASGAI